MRLEPNAPAKRLEHVFKLYWKKYPQAVNDTVNTASFLLGVDTVAPPLLSDSRWTEAVAGMKDEHLNLGESPLASATSIAARVAFLNSMTRDGLFGYDPDGDAIPSRADYDLLRLSRFIFRHFPPHHEADFLIPWIARELVALWKVSLVGPDLERMKAKRAYGEVTDILEVKAPAIAQWAKETRTDINKVDLTQALEAIASYRFKTFAGPQGAVAYRFEDGWTIQDLRTKKELQAEGKNLQHCVGGYEDAVKGGESRIFSLRDSEGRSYVTMEWRPDASSDYWRPDLSGDVARYRAYAAMTPEQFADPIESGLAAQYRRHGTFEQIFGNQNCSLAGTECLEWMEARRGDTGPLASDGEPEDGWRAEDLLRLVQSKLEEFIRARFAGDAYGLFMVGVPAAQIDWAGVAIHESSGQDNYYGADLRHAHIVPGTTFEKVRNANFAGLDLSKCDFSDGNVSGADFGGCDLEDAHFNGTNCDSANFDEADLSGASFDHGSPGGTGPKARLNGASMQNITISNDTDFRGVTGLDISDEQLLFWGNDERLDLYRIFGRESPGGGTLKGFDFFKDPTDGDWKSAREARSRWRDGADDD